MTKAVRLQKLQALENMLLEFLDDERPSNGNRMMVVETIKIVQRCREALQ